MLQQLLQTASLTSLHKSFPLGVLPCSEPLHFSPGIPLARTESKLINTHTFPRLFHKSGNKYYLQLPKRRIKNYHQSSNQIVTISWRNGPQVKLWGWKLSLTVALFSYPTYIQRSRTESKLRYWSWQPGKLAESIHILREKKPKRNLWYTYIRGIFKKFPHFYTFAWNGEGGRSSNWSCLRVSCD